MQEKAHKMRQVGAGRRNAIYFQRDYAEDGVKPENLTMACSGGAC